MHIDFLMDVFHENEIDNFIVWKDQEYSYKWLAERVESWRAELLTNLTSAPKVVAVRGDFSPNSVALMLAIFELGHVFVPLTESVKSQQEEFLKISQAQILIEINQDDKVNFTSLSTSVDHELYKKLFSSGKPGLVLFSSGSTGVSKAALHDVTGILRKFMTKKRKMCAISFLLYDHIGGVNTLLYTLSNAGKVVTLSERKPEVVAEAVEKHKVELLPASPSFLNLFFISNVDERFNLSSLKVVTYGTEPMPESTLFVAAERLKHVKLQQTYGLSELGILRSKSKSNSSLWVKVGGEGFDTRIVEGLLEVRAESAMLGYLNAQSPFTEDGWFMTGDRVEVDGEYIKILGRDSEIINVGGEKVYPAEIESVILKVQGVDDVIVKGESNPILGQIVVAEVSCLVEGDDFKQLQKLIRQACVAKLNKYKVPVKVKKADLQIVSDRFKKIRART